MLEKIRVPHHTEHDWHEQNMTPCRSDRQDMRCGSREEKYEIILFTVFHVIRRRFRHRFLLRDICRMQPVVGHKMDYQQKDNE